MGLLDEAIRDHLDLKRRRGADPTEIERAEREALGPVRRDAVPSFPPELESEVPADTVSAEVARAPSVDERPHRRRGLLRRARHDADELEPAEFPRELEPDTDEPVARSLETEELRRTQELAPTDPFDDEPSAVESAEIEADRPARAPMPDPAEAALGETAEYDVEGAFKVQPEDEDVLEETPEFLQDTPEHDRLWFEQRPPRDFDFDG